MSVTLAALVLHEREREKERKKRDFALYADGIKPIDVGLDESLASQNDRGLGFFGRMGERSGRHLSMVSRWSPPITYLHIFENKDFSVSSSPYASYKKNPIYIFICQ